VPTPDDLREPAVEFCARSDVGRVRQRNEDTLELRPQQGWAVLADGMGGYRGGDVASRIAVAAVLRRLERAVGPEADAQVEAACAMLADAAREANADILRAARATPELSSMGSTLLTAVFLSRHVVSAHLGDSRLYRLQRGVLAQLTRDHTMLQEQIDGGIMTVEAAARSRFKGMLTRGLGVSEKVNPEVGVHDAQAGDVFLMCSDGLTDMLSDREIAAVLGAGGPIEAAAERLVELANLNGGRDNISVIVARKRR